MERNSGTSWEPIAKIQVTDDNNGNNRDEIKDILEIEPRIFAGRKDACCKRNKRIKDDSVWGLNK